MAKTTIKCIDCFIDEKAEETAEFIIMGTAVCRVHAAMRIRRTIHGHSKLTPPATVDGD